MPDDWRAQAACKRANPALFDAPDKPGPGDLTARYAPAAQFCATCPVQTACLAEAYACRDTGFRGGILLLRHNQSAAKPKPQPTTPRQLAPCGTWSAYKRHVRRGEAPCEPCCGAMRTRQEEPDRPVLAPCGTNAAYRRHLRRKELIDAACAEAGAASRKRYRANSESRLARSA